ncbi:hypothetical protein RJ640_001594 [Escallonia rubra]|uniref:Uncharacterized protein n=1 Tax=Escallonia rubra TaxID=112253 RepID=A0AA88USV4_9ASTE|nr:hypothetical protein RJ640_001594 [Escallonia rubra]
MAEPSKKPEPTKKTISPYVKAIAGSLGGIVEASCLQPIDVTKGPRLQLDRTATYKGIVHCGLTMACTEGVRALWKGLTPFATHLTLKYALRMGSNAVLQSAFKDPVTGHISNRGRLLSGFGAGVLEALVIVTPFEVSYFAIGRVACLVEGPPPRLMWIPPGQAIMGGVTDQVIGFYEKRKTTAIWDFLPILKRVLDQSGDVFYNGSSRLKLLTFPSFETQKTLTAIANFLTLVVKAAPLSLSKA